LNPRTSLDPTYPSLEDIQYSNTHAHFHLPRQFSDKVMVFFDLGLNITPAELDSSFLPSGMHSVWMVNNILNGDRIALPNGTVRTTNTRLYDQLKRIDNRELLRKILEIISSRAIGQSDPPQPDVALEELRRNLEHLPIFDFEREVLDLIQDELAFSPSESETDASSSQLGADEAREQVFRSKYTAYPIVATNGMFANVHSGKFRLDVEGHDELDADTEAALDDILGIPYSDVLREYHHDEVPELKLYQNHAVGESIVKGMQIYSPFTRNTSRKRVSKGHENIVRFPLRLTQLLIPDDFFKESLDLGRCQDDVLGMMSWIEQHLNEYKEQMASLINAHTRVEYFLQYEQNLDLPRENLDKTPNLAFCLKKVNTRDLAGHLRSQTEDCMAPLQKLREHMQLHRQDGSVANVSGFTPAAKAGLIVTAELLIALLDFHPYQPWHLKTFMALDGRKHGSWCIPQQFQIPLSDEERLRTCLPYGVNPIHMKRKISFGSGHEHQLYNAIKASSMSVSYAFQIRSKVRLALFFVQAIEKLQATLQYYSADRNEEMLTTVLNPNANAATVGREGIPSADHAQLMLLDGIDYVYLANSLTNPRRIAMINFIGEITCNLYHQNWHDLLTSKRHGQSQEHIDINSFPKTTTQFANLLLAPAGNLNWGFHEASGQRVIINTPSK
jgi:hypothetical protein